MHRTNYFILATLLICLYAGVAHSFEDLFPVQQKILSETFKDIEAQGDYLYVATGGGLSIYNTVSADEPYLVSDVALAGYTTFVNINGDYACVGARFDNLSVLDIHDPHNPELVYDRPMLEVNEKPYMYSNYLYVPYDSYIAIYDFLLPESIDPVATIWHQSIAQAYVKDDYLFMYGFNEVIIYNLMNQPDNPELMATIELDAYIEGVLKEENKLFIYGTPFGGSDEGIYVRYDIEDPSNPEQVQTYTNDDMYTHAVYQDGFVHLSCESGIRSIAVFPPNFAYFTLMGGYTTLAAFDNNTMYACDNEYYTNKITGLINNIPDPFEEYADIHESKASVVTMDDSYVYTKSDTTVHIMEYDDDSVFVDIGNFELTSSITKILRSDNFLYISTLWNGSIYCVDISDISDPYIHDVMDLNEEKIDICVNGDNLLVTADTLYTYDVTYPEQPLLLSESYLQDGYSYKTQYENDMLYILIHNNNASSVLKIIDVSDPSSPYVRSSHNLGSMAEDFVVNDDNVWVTTRYYAGDNVIQVYDVSDPDNVYMITEYDDHYGRLAYSNNKLVCGDMGITLLDVEDRTQSYELASERLCQGTRQVYYQDESLHVFDGQYYFVFDTSTLPVAELKQHPVPLAKSLTLSPSYPNPFNSSTTITLELPATGKVNVTVHDINGRLVTTIAKQVVTGGRHTFHLNGNAFASGMYFVRAESPAFGQQVQKITLIK